MGAGQQGGRRPERAARRLLLHPQAPRASGGDRPALPSNFGFAAAIHPRDTSTAYCIPLDGMKRTASPFGIGVYRTTDKGKTWGRLDKGLPEGAPMESVREGMHNDRLDPMGLYFGTANGDVWASTNEGESWKRITQYLPYV